MSYYEQLCRQSIGSNLYRSAFGEKAHNEIVESQLAKRFGVIHNQLLSNMGNSWGISKYKSGISSKRNINISVATIQLSLFGDVITEEQRQSFYGKYILDALAVFAKELFLQVYHNGKLDEFKEDMEHCQQLLLKFCKDGAILFGKKVDVPDMDICSQRDVKWLMELLALCFDEGIYQNLYSVCRDQSMWMCKGAVRDICKHSEEISAKIMSYIPKQFKKEATKSFIKIAGSIYGFYVSAYMADDSTNNELFQTARQARLKYLPENKALPSGEMGMIEALMDTAKIDAAFADCEALRHGVLDVILDLTKGGDTKNLQYITGKAIKNPDVATSGLVLLMMEDIIWAYGSPQRAALIALNNLSAVRMQSMCREMTEIIEAKGVITMGTGLWNDIEPIVNNVLSLFANPDEQYQDADDELNPGISGTNRQVLSLNGLTLADTACLPSSEKLMDTFYVNCRIHGTPLPEVLGAELAINILHRAGLIGNYPRKMEDDRPEFIQRAMEAEAETKRVRSKVANLEALLGKKDEELSEKDQKILELERKLAAKDKEIEKLQCEKDETKQQLDDLILTVEQLGNEEFEVVDEGPHELVVPDCMANMRILTYGGPHSFASQLQELLPNVSIYECGKMPPASTLRLSDVVFLQVQYMGHSDYYAIRDLCKANQVPVFHIPSKGAQKAAEFICKKAAELSSRL